jgi:hypothetical protein
MTASDRACLEKAKMMMMIGDIPVEYTDNKLFSPSFCPHLLQDIRVVVGGSEPVVDPVDEVDMKHAFILLGSIDDEILFTISDSNLSVNKGDAVMLLRNARPYPPKTLLDVFNLNPRYYSISALKAGASLVLKEGDILLAKYSSCSYCAVDSRRPGPQKLGFKNECQVYACVPGFASNANAMDAFKKTGVLLDIRRRIEMFVGMYYVEWDIINKKVVYSVNDALKSQYRNETFAQLKSEARKIRAPDYGGSDPSTDDEEVVDAPAESAEASGDGEPVAKKAKVDE